MPRFCAAQKKYVPRPLLLRPCININCALSLIIDGSQVKSTSASKLHAQSIKFIIIRTCNLLGNFLLKWEVKNAGVFILKPLERFTIFILWVPAPPDISFLPCNFFAKNLLATLLLASEPDSQNIVCDNCDSGEHPETRCQQCTRFLCRFCTESHRRSRDTKSHTLSTLDELKESDAPVIAETVRCQKHEGEVIKLYCKTCEETICRDCTIVDHRQHDYVFARDVSQEKKDELLRLVGQVRQKRSEMADGLEYLKRMEEIPNESNESTVRKINQYFADMGSIAENKQKDFLEEASTVTSAKLKQLHLRREELELNLGSCNSSIEFTEQAFKNGNDVQMLNLTKYMNTEDKNTEVNSPHDDQSMSVTELPDHANLSDRMAQFHFVENSPDMYTATFRSASKNLEVEVESEIIIQRKDGSTVRDKNNGTQDCN